jgi:threonine synthase
MTPIIPFDENVLLKMDYYMPTLSFKDRGAAVLISHCKAIGVTSVVQDSSGNAGNSVAAGLHNNRYDFDESCLLAGVKSCLALAGHFSERKI